jgi:cobalt/nickel transport system permease protein
MRHSFLDKYSDIGSVIHCLDPRVKIISFFIYIFLVILTPPMEVYQFVAYFIIIFIVLLITRVPIIYVLKRTLIIIPFVLLVGIFIPFFKEDQIGGGYNLGFLRLSYSGLWIFWNVLIKSWLTVLAMTILSTTTKFSFLLRGLEVLYIPKILIILLSFMYRYIFILLDEVQRIEQTWKSRYFGGRYLRQMKIFGNIIGSFFVRAYERGERVYQSMCARGFEGKIYTLNKFKFSIYDFYFCILFLGSLVTTKIWKFL